VYRDDTIVATLTPVGLAFKVTNEVHDELIGSGRAMPLRYFPDSPIKRNYVLLEDREAIDASDAARLLLGEHIPW